MVELKEQFDIIYLLDREIGIDSGHENERPCLIISLDDDGCGYVVPLTSKHKPNDLNRMQHRLACGSWIDLSDSPIFVNEARIKYSRLTDLSIDDEDIEVLEYRFSEWI
ncbi:MAG: hypothetical protein TYPL_4360 [Candidatus Tyloplasma litorale]|nr:MAG: hypothetical protein TYPL_4360 [Mycoplasmatales bacterium]